MVASTRPEFNPSGDDRVRVVKTATEALLDLCRSHVHDKNVDLRCMAIAITNYEQAAMWAVKAITAQKAD
jgi:hypothetical protein